MPSSLSSSNITVSGSRRNGLIICTSGICSGGITTETGLFSSSVKTFEKARSWTRTPDWKRLKKEGRLPQNPFSTWDRRESGVTSTSHVVLQDFFSSSESGSVRGVDEYWYPIRQLYSPRDPIDLVDRWDLDAKLSKNLHKKDWQSPVFFAEGRKTVEMVSQAASTLVDVIRALRRGNIASVFTTLGLAQDKRITRRFRRTQLVDPSRAAANAWLQLQYGWVPLLADVESAATTFASLVADSRNRVLTAGAHAFKGENRREAAPFSGHPIGSGFVEHDVTYTDSWKYKIQYTINEPLREFGQLGLLNPLSVAWELVPFSFVADWFLPIGDYIGALDVDMRYTFQRGLESRKRTSVGKFVSVSPGEPDGSPGWSMTHVAAIPMASLPTPRLADLSLSANLNAKRLTSGIALLRQNAVRLLGGKRG